jgi:SAM-dependent methyltransferase
MPQLSTISGTATADLDQPCPAGCGGAAAGSFVLSGYHVHRCGACGLYSLERLAGTPVGSDYDRSQFDGALAPIRRENYARILQRIRAYKPTGRLLDVGCSSGWFLAAAQAAGFDAFGIEPDEFFWRQAQHNVSPDRVATGRFPVDLPAAWGRFDIIIFNDVFEHLADPLAMLAAVRERLHPDGVLVLALPMASGFVFRIGSAGYRFGLRQGLERMFQIRYPYPHLFYYSQPSLAALARRSGFDVLMIERLRNFSLSGSLHRARMDQARTLSQTAMQIAMAAGLVVFALLERWLPSDNSVAILRPIRDAA